jgi:hypothetical protein
VPPLRQGSVAQSFIFVSHKSPVNPIQQIIRENIVIVELSFLSTVIGNDDKI